MTSIDELRVMKKPEQVCVEATLGPSLSAGMGINPHVTFSVYPNDAAPLIDGSDHIACQFLNFPGGQLDTLQQACLAGREVILEGTYTPPSLGSLSQYGIIKVSALELIRS